MLRFSIIIPFHADLASLTRCLRVLAPLTPNREILIAADGAIEDCRPLAAACGARVIAIDGPSGPATARNAAARDADGDVLVFIDADVVVSRAALDRLERTFEDQPDTAAVFGAYDDNPADPRFISQYKNLSHAFVHRSSSSAARTFWTGFGAVRRDAFFAVRGFDERFARPSVEDIDFGYRLTDAGYRVVLDPKLSACHLKRWGLRSSIVSDLRDRGIPWTQLIWRYGTLQDDLNVRTENRWSIFVAYLAVSLLAFAAFIPSAYLAAGMALAMLTVLNGPHFRFFYEKRGVVFAARAWLLQFVHHLCNGLSFLVGTGLFLSARHLGWRLPGTLPVDPWHAATARLAPADGEFLGDAAVAAPWRLGSAIVSGLSQLAVGVFLARLLAPEDFGVMTLVLVVFGLLQPLADLGIANAIVQRAQLTDRQVRTAFTFTVLLGCSAGALVVLTAPWIAALLRNPATTPVLRLLAAAFVLRAAAAVAGGLLRRRLDFRRQFVIDGVSHAIGFGVVATTMAILGYGVWALAWGALSQAVASSVAQFVSARHAWRPCFAFGELRDLLRFGFGSSFSGSANYIALNGDNFVIGRWIGAAGLGLYDRAYFLMNLPHTAVASVLSAVLFPALARVQNDAAALRRGYLLASRVTAIVAAPAMATIAVAGPFLVPALYGSQWAGVVVPLQILCVAGYFRALYHLGGVVAQSAGRVYSELWRQVLYAGLVVGGAFAGKTFGLAGVAVGVTVAILYMFVVTGQLALRVTRATWMQYLGVQLGAIATAAITFVVALLARAALVSWSLPNAAIAAGILCAAFVPWSLGVFWTLNDPQLSEIRARLSASFGRLVPRETAWAGGDTTPAISALHRSAQ